MLDEEMPIMTPDNQRKEIIIDFGHHYILPFFVPIQALLR